MTVSVLFCAEFLFLDGLHGCLHELRLPLVTIGNHPTKRKRLEAHPTCRGDVPRATDHERHRRCLPVLIGLEMAEFLAAIKKRQPDLSVRAVVRQARASLPRKARLAPSGVNGLLDRKGDAAALS